MHGYRTRRRVLSYVRTRTTGLEAVKRWRVHKRLRSGARYTLARGHGPSAIRNQHVRFTLRSTLVVLVHFEYFRMHKQTPIRNAISSLSESGESQGQKRHVAIPFCPCAQASGVRYAVTTTAGRRTRVRGGGDHPERTSSRWLVALRSVRI